MTWGIPQQDGKVTLPSQPTEKNQYKTTALAKRSMSHLSVTHLGGKKKE